MRASHNQRRQIGSWIIILALCLFSSLPLQARGPANTLTVEQAYTQKRSDIFLEAGGTVIKLLADDNKGSRHQRFLLRLASGHTVLIVHNIDLVARVPVRPGDVVQVRGEYEWTDKGGLIHWTHRRTKKNSERPNDSQQPFLEGWIQWQGKVYR